MGCLHTASGPPHRQMLVQLDGIQAFRRHLHQEVDLLRAQMWRHRAKEAKKQGANAHLITGAVRQETTTDTYSQAILDTRST